MSVSADLLLQDDLARRGFHGAFTSRIPSIEPHRDREVLMERFREPLRRAASNFAPGLPLIEASQIHGAEVAVVGPATTSPVPGVDALVTCDRGVVLGISVADCAPVWLREKSGKGLAMIHSGKAGTLLGAVPAALEILIALTNSEPAAVAAFIGPCIRPPDYEMDIAAVIRGQLRHAGVKDIFDCGENTAAQPERCYSYRRDKGLTGRHLALGRLG